MKNKELSTCTRMMWHGGSLSYKPSKYTGCKGKWEHGPGLYLSTSYEVARKYAKGGKKTSLITFQLGNEIRNQVLPLNAVVQFIQQYVKVAFRKPLINEITMKWQNNQSVPAYVLVNLLINDEALPTRRTVELNQFLVEHGIDYILIPNFGGSSTAVVLLNFELIQQVKVISAKEVELGMYNLDF